MKKFLQVYSAMVKRALLKYTKVMANRYWWKREESEWQMSTVKLYRTMSALPTHFFVPCRSIYSNSPPTKSHESSRHLKTNSILLSCTWKHIKKNPRSHLSTKEPKEGSHLLPLDDKSRGLGHFEGTPLIRTLARPARPARPRGALGALAMGSFQLEASLDLEGVWTFAGCDPDSDRGGSAAPRACLLHPGSV